MKRVWREISSVSQWFPAQNQFPPASKFCPNAPCSLANFRSHWRHCTPKLLWKQPIRLGELNFLVYIEWPWVDGIPLTVIIPVLKNKVKEILADWSGRELITFFYLIIDKCGNWSGPLIRILVSTHSRRSVYLSEYTQVDVASSQQSDHKALTCKQGQNQNASRSVGLLDALRVTRYCG